MADYGLTSGKGSTIREDGSNVQGFVDVDLTSNTTENTEPTDTARVAMQESDGDIGYTQLNILRHSINREEKLHDFSSAQTGTVDLDLDDGTLFVLEIGNGAVSLTISNAPSSTKAGAFTLVLTQYSTAQTITWPTGVLWSDGEEPDVSTDSAVYIITFMFDGSNWYGFMAGSAMS